MDGENFGFQEHFILLTLTAYFGSSLIDLNTKEVEIKTYGAGMICGGNLLKLNNQVYRTVDGGIAPIDQNLDINLSLKIGSYETLYSASSSNQNIYLGRSEETALIPFLYMTKTEICNTI